MKYFHSIIFSLICCTFLSCKDEKEHYSVDQTLEPYLNLFLQEAKTHGLNFNVEKDGIILKFDKLDYPTIGLCTYSNPILVQIDRSYWNEVADYANCEDLRQDVVFHELAHGLLNRRHDNALLPNNEWKSIMCGGDAVRERSWQVNFSGIRKQYYIDELFRTRIESPEWSHHNVSPSETLGHKVSFLNTSKDSYFVDQDGNIFSISNGVYSATFNSNNNVIAPIETKLDLKNDFYYEFFAKCDINTKGSCIGIFTGYKGTDNKEEKNYFLVYYNKTYNEVRCSANNTRCFNILAEVAVSNNIFTPNDYAHFSIERKNDQFYFFINNKLVYHNDFDADKTCTSVGIVAPGKTTIFIDSAAVFDNTDILKSYSLNAFSENHTSPKEMNFSSQKEMNFSSLSLDNLLKKNIIRK